MLSFNLTQTPLDKQLIVSKTGFINCSSSDTKDYPNLVVSNCFDLSSP